MRRYSKAHLESFSYKSSISFMKGYLQLLVNYNVSSLWFFFFWNAYFLVSAFHLRIVHSADFESIIFTQGFAHMCEKNLERQLRKQ